MYLTLKDNNDINAIIWKSNLTEELKDKEGSKIKFKFYQNRCSLSFIIHKFTLFK